MNPSIDAPPLTLSAYCGNAEDISHLAISNSTDAANSLSVQGVSICATEDCLFRTLAGSLASRGAGPISSVKQRRRGNCNWSMLTEDKNVTPSGHQPNSRFPLMYISIANQINIVCVRTIVLHRSRAEELKCRSFQEELGLLS